MIISRIGNRLNQFVLVCWRRFAQMFPDRRTYLVNGSGGNCCWDDQIFTVLRKDEHFIDNCLREMAIYRRDLRPLAEMCWHLWNCKSSNDVPLQPPSSHLDIFSILREILNFFTHEKWAIRYWVGVCTECISQNRARLFFFFHAAKRIQCICSGRAVRSSFFFVKWII